MKKSKFIEILNLLLQWKKKSEVLESQGIDICALGDELELVNKLLLNELVGTKAEDWISWWVFEDEDARTITPTGSLESISLSTPDELYEYIFNNYEEL